MVGIFNGHAIENTVTNFKRKSGIKDNLSAPAD